MLLKNILLVLGLLILLFIENYFWIPLYLILFTPLFISIIFKFYFKKIIKLNFIIIYLYFLINKIMFYISLGIIIKDEPIYNYYNLIAGIIFNSMWLIILKFNKVQFKNNKTLIFRKLIFLLTIYFCFISIAYYTGFLNNSIAGDFDNLVSYAYYYLNIFFTFIFINKIIKSVNNL